MSRAMVALTVGVSSLGLMTTALPAAMAAMRGDINRQIG